MIKILNRKGEEEIEPVYGYKAISWLYGGSISGKWLAFLSARLPFVSAFYGWLMKRPSSKKKILPFIEKYRIDPSEFVEKPGNFKTFNDFFIRKLKPRVLSKSTFICPADGRYRFFPKIHESDGFYVKGENFNLKTLLQDEKLAQKYEKGSMVIARLCPLDYHRFHFTHDGSPSEPKLINGYLYSVNPIALKKDITIFTQNKRVITTVHSEWGESLYLEIGATNVGSIRETFIPNTPVKKGDEKGYFEFGASSLILLFEPDMIAFDSDLLSPNKDFLEIKCHMGESLGRLIRG